MKFWQVQEKLEELYTELAYLEHITDGLDREGDPRDWQQSVESIACVNEIIQNQLHKFRHVDASYNQKAVEELNMKVTENLATVKSLKELAFKTFLGSISGDKLKHYSHDDHTIFTSKFSTEIGSGGFSKVYRCQLSDGVQGAVKVLTQHGDKSKDALQDIFVIEVSTMIKASHPNLIKLYGFCFDDDMKALVYEYMEKGSLEKVLFTKDIKVEWKTLYAIATKVAKVLAYLHDECGDQIIHHDIKPGNVLLDSNLSPKVTDFGVSKIMSRDASHFTRTAMRGTSSYIAPEMIIPASRVTYACDIYSFGKVLFDILGMRINNKHQPFLPNQVWIKFNKGELHETLKEFDIGEKDEERATILCRIAFWCIQFTPEIRPLMKNVVIILENNLLVPVPPNPNYESGEHFSIQQLPDGTYAMVSHSSSKSLAKGNLTVDGIDYRAYVKKWHEETSEKDFVEELPKSTPKEFSYEDLMSFTENFSTKISSGEFADIYKGEFTNGEQIAVKVMRRKSMNSDGDDINVDNRFKAEIKTMSMTSHLNIIKLHGFCSERNMHAFVLEYMVNGSLEKLFLEKHYRSMEWEHLYCIATETAKGLSYLHNAFGALIPHMHVNPSHILLDSYLSPKVTNFGAAPRKDWYRTHITSSVNMAPEGTFGGHPTVKSDVYSFGILLLQIFDRQEKVAKQIKSYWREVEKGQTKELLRKLGFREKNRKNAEILLMVAFWCIQYTPKIRPLMRTVVKMLEKEIKLVKPPNPFVPHKPYALK